MYAHRPDSNDEVISVLAELRQLEDIARETNDKWVGSRRRLDVLRSNTGIFPPETLSLIFQHARHLMPGGPIRRAFHPLFFGSISHSWRQVAWSTPQLWTELFLIIPVHRAKRYAQLLDLYLTNVRGLPLSLSIFFRYEDLPDLKDDPIAQIFFREENSRKFGNLSLKELPTTWLGHFGGPYSQLLDAYIECSGDSMSLADTAFFTNAPMLRELSLRGIDTPPKAPCIITTLNLDHVSTALALQCLLESPNLVEFRFIHPIEGGSDSDEERDDPPAMPDILTLHHLETLQWPYKPNRTSDRFLRRIRLPALRSLDWVFKRPPTDAFLWAIRFFFRHLSSAPLSTLHLTAVDITFVEYIYRMNPRIEMVSLGSCDEEAIRLLTPGCNGGGSANERLYLPKLRMLKILGCSYDDLPESFGEILANLLVGRARADSVPSLCVNLRHTGKVRWMAGTKEKLQELIRGGAKVQLLDEGRQMDWKGSSRR